MKKVHQPLLFTSASGRKDETSSPKVGTVQSTAITRAAMEAHLLDRPDVAAWAADIRGADSSCSGSGSLSVTSVRKCAHRPSSLRIWRML